jgi:hypothetical protein
MEGLEDEAHVAAAPQRERIVVAVVEARAVDADLARIRAVEAGDDVEQRRLARARLADDGEPFAGRDVEVDAGEQRRARKALRQAPDLQQRAPIDR